MQTEDYAATLRDAFCDRFNKLIALQNIVLSDLAKYLQRAPGLLTQWRQCKLLPSLVDLVGIARYTGTSLDYLTGGVSNNDPTLSPVRVVQNPSEYNHALTYFLKTEKPASVLLIQYSATNVVEIITTALEAGSKVYLLVKHPSYSPGDEDFNFDRITKFQQGKIANQLRILLYFDYRLEDNPNFHARCYWFPGAMRATFAGIPSLSVRQLLSLSGNGRSDDTEGLLSLSVYRYTRGFQGVMGGSNPLIHTSTSTPEGKTLLTLFEDTFVELWQNSVPATDVVSPSTP